MPHQLWTGADFTSSTDRDRVLVGPVGTGRGRILWFRFAVPVIRSVRHRLVVDRVVVEAPDIISVWMAGRGLDHLGIAAGQFCTWRFLGPGWTRANPFTVSAVPTASHGCGSRCGRR